MMQNIAIYQSVQRFSNLSIFFVVSLKLEIWERLQPNFHAYDWLQFNNRYKFLQSIESLFTR